MPPKTCAKGVGSCTQVVQHRPGLTSLGCLLVSKSCIHAARDPPVHLSAEHGGALPCILRLHAQEDWMQAMETWHRHPMEAAGERLAACMSFAAEKIIDASVPLWHFSCPPAWRQQGADACLHKVLALG